MTPPMRIFRHQATPRAPVLVILLPGAYMTPAHFVEAGFTATVAARKVAVDVAIPELTLGDTDESALLTLREKLIVPSREEGYKQIWLGGISLGGFLALSYATQHAADIDGLCLIAPYPGNRITTGTIVSAGGLDAWQPQEGQLEDPEFRVWNWLRSRPTNLPVYCAYGRDDRFVDGISILTGTLPPESVATTAGGHEWPVWQALWENFLDAAWLHPNIRKAV